MTNKYMNFMKKLSNKNLRDSLSEADKQSALKSLRQLVTGVPINDEDGELIGYIEKPDMRAIAYVLDKFEETVKEKDEGANW